MRRLPALILIALLLLAAGCGGKSGKQADVTDEANAVNIVNHALPCIVAYYSDMSSYAGMTLPKLRFYDAGLRGIVIASAKLSTFCAEATSGGTTAFQNGPNARIEIGSCKNPSGGRPTLAARLFDSLGAIAVYKDDHNGWQGMTLQDLKTIAATWDGSARIPNSLEIVSATKTGYCVQTTSGSETMHIDQSEKIAAGGCP